MWRKIKLAFPAVSLMALVYYADNLILGAPIVALTVWLGGLTAFLILTPIYFAFDYMLGRLTLRIVIEEKEAKDYGRLMRFIRRWFNSFRDAMPTIEKRLSSKNKLRLRAVGYVVASYFGTAFLTMPVMYLLGQRRFLRTLTAISAAIYALTFVAQYALGTSIVLEVIKRLF